MPQHDDTYSMLCIYDKSVDNASSITAICQFCTFFIPNLRYSIYHYTNKRISGHSFTREILMKHMRTEANQEFNRIIHYSGSVTIPSKQSPLSLWRNLSSNWFKMLNNNTENNNDLFLLLHELESGLISQNRRLPNDSKPRKLIFILDLHVTVSKKMIDDLAVDIESYYQRLATHTEQYEILVLGALTSNNNQTFAAFVSDLVSAYLKYMTAFSDEAYIDGHLFLPQSKKHKLYEFMIQCIDTIFKKRRVVVTNDTGDHSLMLQRLFAGFLFFARYCTKQGKCNFFSYPSMRNCVSEEFESIWNDIEEKNLQILFEVQDY